MKEKGLPKELETVSNLFFLSDHFFSNIDKVNTSQMGNLKNQGQNGNSRNSSTNPNGNSLTKVNGTRNEENPNLSKGSNQN
jgi:hypothetical protein